MFGLIGSIIIGCLAGFIAGKIMRGGGFGFWMNLLLGIIGGVVGGWTLSLFISQTRPPLKSWSRTFSWRIWPGN